MDTDWSVETMDAWIKSTHSTENNSKGLSRIRSVVCSALLAVSPQNVEA